MRGRTGEEGESCRKTTLPAPTREPATSSPVSLSLSLAPCRILLFLPYSRDQTLGRKDHAESALMEKVGPTGGVCRSGSRWCSVPCVVVAPQHRFIRSHRLYSLQFERRTMVARLTQTSCEIKKFGFRFAECSASGAFLYDRGGYTLAVPSSQSRNVTTK